MRARKLIDRALGDDEPVLVSLLVLVECEWVLRSRYGFSKEVLRSIFSALLESRDGELRRQSGPFPWCSAGLTASALRNLRIASQRMSCHPG